MPAFNPDKRLSYRNEADVIKRVNANLIERKRMEKINHGFDNLKKLLPPPDRKLSKAAVLQHAVQHIKLLQRTVVQIKMENQDLKRRIDAQNTSVTDSGGKNSPVEIPSPQDEHKENKGDSETAKEPNMANKAPIERCLLSKRQKQELKHVYEEKPHRRALNNALLSGNCFYPNWSRNFSDRKQSVSPPNQCLNVGSRFPVPSLDSFPKHFASAPVHQLAHPNTQKVLPALLNYKRIAPCPWKPQTNAPNLEKLSNDVIVRVPPLQSNVNKPHRPKSSHKQHLPETAVKNLDTIIDAINVIENNPFGAS